jgi:hypothetical protein
VSYAVSRLDEIAPRDRWIPVRDHLAISAFGVNAWVGREAGGQIIGAHTEEPTGHEELYLVVSGRALFSVGDKEIDAPTGTLLFVADPRVRRGAVAREPETVVLAIGNKPGEPYSVQQWEKGWQYNQPAMALYRESRYIEAAEVLREGVIAFPENANLHYNLACFAALSGSEEEALGHLERAIELSPSFREAARGDSDFDPVRRQPRFVDAVREP